MSNHNLFSYFDKRVAAERSLLSDGNQDGDTSMEQILAKIVMVQSQIHQLKTRIEKVITENPRKFSSVNTLSLPGSAGNISDEEPAAPAANGQFSSIKSLYVASQLASEGDTADMLLSSLAVSKHALITAMPDAVESTKQIENGILINNRAAKGELLNFKKIRLEQDKKPRRRSKRQKAVSPAGVPEASIPVETPSPLRP